MAKPSKKLYETPNKLTISPEKSSEPFNFSCLIKLNKIYMIKDKTMRIIGREKEINELTNLYNSKNPN